MSETPPDLSAQLAADDEHKERPDGAPSLYPAASLPRGVRADFFAPLRDVDLGTLGGAIDSSSALSKMADAYAAVASIEKALRVVAVNKPAYDAWARAASDETLFDLFGWYFEEMTPGEAQPSQT